MAWNRGSFRIGTSLNPAGSALAPARTRLRTLAPAIKDDPSLLRKQLDKQMTKFKTTNPEFYAGYHAARSIVNRHRHHASPAPAPTTTTAGASGQK